MQTLFVVCGYPGVGKSTVSQIMENHGIEKHQTDKIRKELFGQNPSYSKEESQKTYEEMFSRAEDALKDGKDVIVEGTFKYRQGRERIENIASNNSAECIFIFVTCDSSIVQERIKTRDGYSDADFSVHKRIRDTFEEFQRAYIEIDNSNSKQQLKSQTENILEDVFEPDIV
jgi:predicted kinase